MSGDAIKQITRDPGLRLTDKGVDSVYLFYSMLKYALSVGYAEDQQKQAIKDSYTDTASLIGILLGTAAFMWVAWASQQGEEFQHLSEDERDKLSKKKKTYLFVADYWPYCRQYLSGLKNGRHAAINIGNGLHHIFHNSYKYANPIGIACGVLLAFNLVWYLRFDNKRTAGIKRNQELLADLAAINNNTDRQAFLKNFDTYQKGIYRESSGLRTFALFSAGFDGITDGSYLFACILLIGGVTLSSISFGAPLIIALVACAVCVAVSMISKLEREYVRQTEAKRSALLCEIRLQELKVQAIAAKGDEAQQLLAAENQKLMGLKESLRKTMTDDKHYTGKLAWLWFLGRGLLNGIKNLRDAAGHVQSIIQRNIIGPVLIYLMCGIYAIYLALREGVQLLTTQKQAAKTVAKVEKNHPDLVPAKPEKKSSFLNSCVATMFGRRQVNYMLLHNQDRCHAAAESDASSQVSFDSILGCG